MQKLVKLVFMPTLNVQHHNMLKQVFFFYSIKKKTGILITKYSGHITHNDLLLAMSTCIMQWLFSKCHLSIQYYTDVTKPNVESLWKLVSRSALVLIQLSIYISGYSKRTPQYRIIAMQQMIISQHDTFKTSLQMTDRVLQNLT